ncbi:LemA family protein [Yimella sp. cx-51]|uniref:LemA family protein n=1 Tax=Yimella sp. cx-51 TaxID=2770551 RepID=UPI00165DAD24|nr:LemA family protein [Yimella sp. cx-51]MBC9955707.1 LemA family protein [Yimella sp. cx-51]QTH37725.1 LemA family protein [Yimella sp. cx-51]
MTYVLIALAIIVVLLIVWAIASYNGLVKKRNQVQEAWHQIDVELKRRHDLIPNLIETVKGYAQHERATLDEVLRARSAAINGGDNPSAAAANEGQLTQALGRLMAVAEAYPDLKSNANFLGLQQELSSTEDRIASGRRYYNAIVRELNTSIESIPTKFMAGPAGVARAEYFEAQGNERAVPNVNFGTGPGGTAGGPGGYNIPAQGQSQSAGYPQIEQQGQAPSPLPGQQYPHGQQSHQGQQAQQPEGYPQGYPNQQ